MASVELARMVRALLMVVDHWVTSARKSSGSNTWKLREGPAHRIMLGLVDHLPGLGHLDLSRRSPPKAKADHAGLAEGAAQEMLEEAPHSFLVTRLSPSNTTMNSKSQFAFPVIAALTMFAFAGLSKAGQTLAQTPPARSATTWQDLGFDQLPEGLSTDVIPLFEGLNEARGTWSFEGEMAGDDAAAIAKGSLHIQGNPKAGMVPVWQMAWAWPVDNPGHSIIFNLMAGPREGGFDLMLIRIGPVKIPGADDAKSRVLRTPFQGTWNLQSRTITWTERDFPSGLPGEAAAEDPPKPRQSFDMLVAADGKILIRNSKHIPQGQMVNAKAVVRTGKAPAEPVTLTGKHSFRTAAEIADRRIKPWLPPQATDVALLSERNGHYARYKVEEGHFMKFLDGLWEADKGSSAHKRDEMSEGGPGNPEGIAKRLETAGQKPLGNFRVYYSPSKPSAAMTTYYYDRETGIAYHDRGYW